MRIWFYVLHLQCRGLLGIVPFESDFPMIKDPVICVPIVTAVG